MKICSMEAKLIHADRWMETDTPRLRGTVPNLSHA